jgi:hypothetical protein
MLKLFYKLSASLLIALVAFWVFLAFFLTKPSETELKGFSKFFIEWIISSDQTKISSESIKLIVDNENYRDHLVLRNTALIKKDNNENRGNISEIQVRFNGRSLIQRFYTPIELVISKASILFQKEEGKSSAITKPLDNIFEYFVAMIEKGILDFKSISIIDLEAIFFTESKQEKIKIQAAQIAVNELDNKVYGKVFYEFNKLRHSFDLVASYQDSRYFKINSSFTKLPIHLVLQNANNNLLSNFQNDKNFLEVSGNFEHFFDRKLAKYQNKLDIIDTNGMLYFPDSRSEFIRIDKLSAKIDFSDNWLTVKDFEFHLNNNQSLIINSEINQTSIDNLEIKLKNFPISIYKFFKDFDSTKNIYEFLDESLYAGYFTGNLTASLFEDFFRKQEFTKSYIKSDLTVLNASYSYDKDFLPIELANASCSIRNNDINITVLSAMMNNSHIENSKIFFKIFDIVNNKNEIKITGNASGPASDLVTFIPAKHLEELKKSDIDLANLHGIAHTNLDIAVSPHPDIKTKYNIKSKISAGALNIFDKNIQVKNINLDGVFDGDKVHLSGTAEVNNQKSILEYSYFLDNKVEFDNLLTIKMDIAPSDPARYSAIKILKGHGNLDFLLTSKNNHIKYTTKANLDNLELTIEKIGLVKPLAIPSSLSFNGTITDKSNSALFKLQSLDGIDIKAKVSFMNGGIKLYADKVKYATTDIIAEYSEMKHHAKLKVTGPNIDLSSANLFKILNKESSQKSSETSLNVDNLILKNGIKLNKFNLNIACNKHKCFKGDINALIDNNQKEYFKMWISESGDQEIWSIESNNAGKIISGFDVTKTVKNGLLNMQVGTIRNLNDFNEQISITKGQFDMKNFVTTNSTVAVKMLSFLSFPGLTSSILNRDVQFNSMKSKFEYKDNIFSLSNGVASGPVFDFTFQGTINTEIREYQIKGKVIPSLFGINDFVNWLLNKAPGVGKFLSYGKRKGLLIAPYKISEKY